LCPVIAMKDAVRRISVSCERKDGNRLVERGDDPVLGDAGLGIVARLLFDIPLRLVGADNLDHQIGPKPVGILPARVARVALVGLYTPAVFTVATVMGDRRVYVPLLLR
jgi:hypothetical protein